MALKMDLNDLKRQIKSKISYHYVDQHVLEDKISDYKLMALVLLMNESSLPVQTKENYLLASMLVEIALYTHEQVRENDEILEDYDKSLTKQLSVLGGDYYSSLYYVLLSKLEDYSFINHLASAIKEVNELKMDFYFQENKDLQESLPLRNQIEGHIIYSVADYLKVEDKNIFQIIDLMLLLNLLIQEKEYYKAKTRFNYFKEPAIVESLNKKIDILINDTYSNLQEQIEDLPEESFKQIKDLLEEEKIKYLVHTEEG